MGPRPAKPFGEARVVPVREGFKDQASEGHLVDALALRGDEGRGTLR